MKKWHDHTQAIREHLDALEDEGLLDDSAPAFLGHVKMLEGLDETENALRQRDSIKGKSHA